MHIALTYDLRDDYLALGWAEEDAAEFDRADTIDALERAIRAQGHDVDRVGNAASLMRRLLLGDRWDLVFNIAESLSGTGREALVPAMLDHFDIPHTFGDALCAALTLDKPTTKRVLRDHDLPTPAFAVVERIEDAGRVDIPFPLFAKPSREGSSKGVGPDSIAHSSGELEAVCARLLDRFRQPVLVERYLPGREVTVGITGEGDGASVVGVLEVVEKPGAQSGVYSFENKERCEELLEYRLADDAFASACESLALRAYRALACRDAGRVDLRANERGEPEVIEINCLPGLHPSHSDLPIMATLAGVSYEELIARILAPAIARTASRGAACAS